MYSVIESPVEESKSQPWRVLVIDTDPVARTGLVSTLNDYGFHTTAKVNVSAASPADLEHDIIVISWSLDTDLVSSVIDLSSLPHRPGLVVLANNAYEADRIIGLELGADDFIDRPCSHREIVARMRAVLRRRSTVHQSCQNSAIHALPDPGNSNKGYYKFSGWTLDRKRWLLKAPSGDQVMLTAAEYMMLNLLLQNPGVPLSRQALLENTGRAGSTSSRIVDTNMARLRRKLEALDTKPIIQTVRGRGYAVELGVSYHA